MPRKPLNRSLGAARATKQDEFYTQLSDIEKELRYYTRVRTAQPPLAAGVKPLRSLFPATYGLPCGGPAW